MCFATTAVHFTAEKERISKLTKVLESRVIIRKVGST